MTSIDQLTSRIGHSGIFHDGKVYLFGGFVNSNTIDKPLVYVNDLIQVDVSSRKWEIKTTHNIGPSARNFHSACLRKLQDHDEMIIFGGKSNGFHRDVWSYRFDTNAWVLLEASNSEIITPRYGQSAIIYDDHLIVFGGYDNNSFSSNELFIFNFESREWKLIELSVELERRYYHATAFDEETGDWYIFGGKSATDLVKDFVKVKLSTLDIGKGTCQSEILLSGLDEDVKRFGHSMVLEKLETGTRLLSIGGCNKRIDHLDCIYIDLNDIKTGWNTIHIHSLSHTFKNVSQDVGPVFHANVPFVVNVDDEIVVNYFVFGGVYQKTQDDKLPQVTSITEQVGKQPKKKKEPSFNIDIFDNVMNDDIFRLVLSFLNVPDLCKLQLVSKKLRICRLTIEDQYWKDYYFQKLNLYLEASKTYNYNYNKITRTYETNYVYSELYSQYLKFNSNYKKHLIEIIGECMSKADKDHYKRTSYIESLTQCGEDVYISKEELLKYKLKGDTPNNSAFKIVQVGDGAVGKTCLWISMTTNTFPHEYVPTVFDNYSQNYNCEEKTFNLGLWDTAGPEDYDRLRPLSYPQTDLFFLSFSCSSESSMENVTSKWIPELRHHCPTTAIALVCTKIDFRDDPILSRELLVKKQKKILSFEQGELLAKKMGCITYLETSALKGTGMQELSEVMIKAVCMWNDPSFKQIIKKKRTEKKNCSMQ